MLVSRAKKQAGILSSGLRELGCEVLEIPFIEIRQPASYRPLDTSLRDLATYDWLILTSVNGVEALFERMREEKTPGGNAWSFEDRCYRPGDEAAYRSARLASDSYAEGVHSRIGSQRFAPAREREAVLLVRAKVARDVIPRELRRAGAEVDVVEAYETITPKASATRLRAALASKTRRPHAITFTSSSTVKNFVGLLGLRGARAALRNSSRNQAVRSASIGPVTSATLREFGLPVDIQAGEYTIPGLVAAIVGELGSSS